MLPIQNTSRNSEMMKRTAIGPSKHYQEQRNNENNSPEHCKTRPGTEETMKTTTLTTAKHYQEQRNDENDGLQAPKHYQEQRNDENDGLQTTYDSLV